MKIQFELGQGTHKRHFTSILDEIKKRGHALVMTASSEDCPGLVKCRIANGDHRSLMAFDAFIRDDEWGAIAYLVRTSRDYLRYLRSLHVDSLTIKQRIRNMLELGIPQATAGVGAKISEAFSCLATSDTNVDQLDIVFDAIEGLIPAHPRIVEYLRGIDADLLCVTPYIVTQYGQADLVKAARSLGIPIAFMVGSWDNLTSKGAVHIQPDYTLVWNAVQREEAIRQHAIVENSIYLTGAARFDDFWERRIEISRDEYFRSFGFDPAQPLITYLGSSNLIAADERQFVGLWIDGLRTSGNPRLMNANILLRPHPKFSKGWLDSFGGVAGVGVALSSGSVVSALNNDSALYHSLIHASAVVGANTSAELEAAILGKPVFTIEDEFFRTGQAGTIHFKYLAGPLAKVSHTLAEHFQQMGNCLSTSVAAGINDSFLQNFLRPAGLERRACEVTVDVLDGILKLGRRPIVKFPSMETRQSIFAWAQDSLGRLRGRWAR